MLPKNIRLSDLQRVLDSKYGAKAWVNWEMETIMHDMPDSDYLVAEKVFVLQALNSNLNEVISMPEFLIWTTQVANGEYAEFELVMIPTSLEVAWAIEEVKTLSFLTGQEFKPSESLAQTVAYILKEDGYSKPPKELSFVPETLLSEGQTSADVASKQVAVSEYIKFMKEAKYV